MIYSVKRFIKPSIFVAFVLYGVKVNAQVSLIQNAIDKIESHRNFSYKSAVTQKYDSSDTLIYQQKDILMKTPQDKSVGYLFSMERLINKEKSTDLYDGQSIVTVRPFDSSYRIPDYKASVIYGTSLLSELKRIKNFLEERPSKIVKINDTTISSVTYSHLLVNMYDTIINQDHNYHFVHLYINKLSGMPDIIIDKSRTRIYGDGATNSYIENRYSDFKFDRDDINKFSFTLPKGFHERRPWMPPSLAAGTVAPNWTLYTADGKKMSSAQMNGKVILLDFYFIGCGGCMLSLKPLNNLYEKFKNQNVIIASITERDSKESVLAFDKQYGIKYTSFVDAADMVKSYQVNSAPNFYFIDKEGKIAKVIIGYDDDFEKVATLTIDGLLNKK